MVRIVTKEPPKEEWEARRALIAELYLSPYLTLEDVISILAHEYGFRATPKMFKKYLRAWSLSRKNVDDQRHEMVQIALAHLRIGGNLPLVDKEGRSIPWARVKRNSMRNGRDTAIWRYIQLPRDRPPNKQPDRIQTQTTPSAASNGSGTTPSDHAASWSSPMGSTPSSVVSRRVSSDGGDGDSAASSSSPGGAMQLGHAFSQYRPNSPAVAIELMIHNIGEFQHWRALTVPHAFFVPSPGGTSHTPPPPETSAGIPTSAIAMGNAARENAALSVSNACIDVYQSTVLGDWPAVSAAIAAAQRHFASFLTQPSLFLVYSVLSTHIMTNQSDTLIATQERKLLLGFHASSAAALGPHHPLTTVLAALLADADPESSSSGGSSSSVAEWSIAILDCLANTRDHLLAAEEAARFTSLKMKHGLAWILQLKGYPFSAMSVLTDIIASTLTFTNPTLGKTSWLRSQLASIYRAQGLASHARAVLDEAFSLATQASSSQSSDDVGGGDSGDGGGGGGGGDVVFDDGLLHCGALSGQLYEDAGRIDEAGQELRRVFVASRGVHGTEAPKTIHYARMYCGFLRRHGMEVGEGDEFRGELLSANAEGAKAQKRKLDMFAKYVTLEDAGYT